MEILQKPFGENGSAEGIFLFELRQPNGMRALFTNLGATLVALYTPDRNQQTANIVLGYDSPETYQSDPNYFGTICGRFANRIAGGKLTIGASTYKLPLNNGPNHLHGGPKGFNQKIWHAESSKSGDDLVLVFSYRSPHGEQGYPGNLDVKVAYTLTSDHSLVISYHAETDFDTVVNLTNHAYFNLSGSLSSPVSGHEISIFADYYTPMSAEHVPTGALSSVDGTPFDFRDPVPLGSRMDMDHIQTRLAGGGIDHNFVVNLQRTGLQPTARVYEPISGREMEILSTQPGIQLYTPNFKEPIKGREGIVYEGRCAFCLENQHFPDSPSHPNFPSTLLKPGKKYQEQTVWRFSTV